MKIGFRDFNKGGKSLPVLVDEVNQWVDAEEIDVVNIETQMIVLGGFSEERGIRVWYMMK